MNNRVVPPEGRTQRIRLGFPAAALTLAAALLGSHAQAEDRALLIGVGQYQGGVTLPGVDQDPLLMRDIVKKMGFSDPQIKLLQDREATRTGILNAMKSWLVQGVRAEDRVVFYFSGHGSRIKDLNSDEDDGCDEALVPYDLDNLLIDDDLGAALAQIPAKNVLVVLDSCFSGTATKSQITGQSAAKGSLRPKVLRKTGEMACDKAVNISKGPRGTGVMGMKEESVQTSSTAPAAAPPPQNLIEFDAAAPNEVALTDEGGSLFTLALHRRVMESSRPVSFAELREYAAQSIRTAVSELGDIGFLAYHPQLQGSAAMLGQNALQFGRAAPAAPPLPDITAVSSGRELIDRYLNSSAFKVEIHSNQPQYTLGQAIRYEIYSSDDGYLNLLELDDKGNIAVLFPNRYNQNNQIRGAQINSFPSPTFGNYDFRAIEPYGKTRVVALVTAEPLNLYSVPGNVDGDFMTLLNIEHFRKMAGLMKATGVMPLPTGTTFGTGSVDIEVRR